MNVFHFGNGDRRLFGIYAPGRGEGRTARAALLCAPWGQEYLRAHRSMRQLGLQLGTAGFHTLRFDYYGTGDSAGEMTEATVEGWADDLSQAIDELRDSSGAERVSLVGLRLGGALAARVAIDRPRDIRDLVLWDPVVSGRDYLDELHAPMAGVAPVRRDAAVGGGLEANGFPLTDAMEAGLAAVDLVPLAESLPARTLVVTSVPREAETPAQRALRVALAHHPYALEVEAMESAPAWLEQGNSGAATIPVAILQRISGWLA
jgi:pimeloyl-ACP methyl ester carboxylesterase